MKGNATTVFLIATSAAVVTVLFHESIHAVTCCVLGGTISGYSALHVDCTCVGIAARIVAGSASLANLALAALVYPLLRRTPKINGNMVFFLWLCFLFNLLLGTGYWVVSGVANFGDWAAVIEALTPAWMYRVGLAVIGILTFMAAVALGLREFGRIVGGTTDELFGRAQRMATISYVASLCSITVIGSFHPAGFMSTPVLAGLFAAAGAFSPLLWMMQWFRADLFHKHPGNPLRVVWATGWLALAIACLAVAIATTRFGAH